jgi:S-ribosylhomocysteine lyase
MRDEVENVIDLSPMGCRTGFYFIVWGEPSIESIQKALCRSLQRVIEAQEVPAANPVQCGNYRDLSLFGAQEYAKLVLKAFQAL